MDCNQLRPLSLSFATITTSFMTMLTEVKHLPLGLHMLGHFLPRLLRPVGKVVESLVRLSFLECLYAFSLSKGVELLSSLFEKLLEVGKSVV